MICPYNRKSETLREVWEQKSNEETETSTPSSGSIIKQAFTAM